MSLGATVNIPENPVILVNKPEDHLGLVCMVVSKYVPKGTPIEDSEEYAEGVVALVIACDKFEPERHLEFSTYAVACIKKALIQKWRRQKRQKRDGIVSSIGERAVIAPDVTDDYEFLMSLVADHPEDTWADRRNKRVLVDHHIEGMTWQEIGDQMESRYGGERPVTKVCVRNYADAAVKLIRERFDLDEFARLEEILS